MCASTHRDAFPRPGQSSAPPARSPAGSPRRRWRRPVVGLGLVAFGVVVGQLVSVRAEPEAASPFRNLGVLARALAHLEAGYVDEVDQDELIRGAIRGMAGALDPHTTYLDPDAYRTLSSDTEGRFAGIGVEITVRDGWLVVLAVFPGGPAERAGLEPGDRFLTLEGRPARDMRLQDAVTLMRGPPGTDVRVSVRREGRDEGIELTLTRAFIEVSPVQATVLPGRILHLRVRSFQANTTRELRAAIERGLEATREGLAGILLDLRDNPGGLLQQAVLVSEEFLPTGTIVTTRGRGGRVLHSASAHSRGTRPDWPMVVLVNGYSASAAEIVAGALQDHGRAVLVGTTTFGKGSVQNIVELPDGGALKMTIARYFTPSGRSIQALGIEPDVVVPAFAPEALRRARVEAEGQIREASLTGHLDGAPVVVPRRERGALRDAPDARETVFSEDHQARMGYETLRAIITDRARGGE